MMKLYVKLLKKFWKTVEKSDQKRLSKQSPPEGVIEIRDIPYGTNGTDNLLDIYYPQGTDKPLPVIFDIHGGGWTYGNKELNKYYNMYLASYGFTVVSINYRLVYDFGIEHIVEDIFAALNWLEKNHGEYFCDINNLFITGDSAGGHLASLTAAILESEEAQAVYGVKSSLKIKAGGYVCAAFFMDKMFKVPVVGKIYSRLMFKRKDYKNSKFYPYCSFEKIVKDKFIPAYAVTGADDFIKSFTFDFVEYAKEKNFTYKYRYYAKEKGKKYPHVFCVLFPTSHEGQETNKEMCDFFKSYITE